MLVYLLTRPKNEKNSNTDAPPPPPILSPRITHSHLLRLSVALVGLEEIPQLLHHAEGGGVGGPQQRLVARQQRQDLVHPLST